MPSTFLTGRASSHNKISIVVNQSSITCAALAAFALSVAAGGAHAQQKLPTVSELLKAEAKATEACEGGGDPAVISEQCRLRDRISGRLAQAGWCWGRKGQTDVKKEWHACQPDSIYEDDIEAVQP